MSTDTADTTDTSDTVDEDRYADVVVTLRLVKLALGVLVSALTLLRLLGGG